MSKRLPVVLASVLVLSAGAAPSSVGADAAPGSAAAHAFGVRINGTGGTQEISAPPQTAGFIGPFTSGSIVSTGSGNAYLSADTGTTANASATLTISDISMFGGDFTVKTVTVKAEATAKQGAASGSFPGLTVDGVTVLGQAVPAGAGTIQLGDWGYAIILGQGATQQTTSSYRGYVVGVEAHVTVEHNGVPAGTTVQIGYVDVSVDAPTGEAAKPVKPLAPPKPVKPPAQAPTLTPPEPPDNGIPLPPLGSSPPPGSHPKLKGGTYVFPVFGPSSFVNTFGSPRSDVAGGWHHGADIFAPLGAPILAVATGTVFSVGWNDVGGYRLWLRDRVGNQFYYAHLSAYSPLAVNNARVQAGDVLGFVGNSGDAQTTPYHLHFEVHPVQYLGYGYNGAVDPTGYLLEWQHLQDVRFSAAEGWAPTPNANSRAPQPGAILLQVKDISSASGLEPSSLKRALAPVAREGVGGILHAPRPAPNSAD
ncbi:MAG: M23 family metallopeptidase, partial [Actinomycetota bacterium]|nr:M23 family metallopeptidase [Actinomycetota bacterium]